MDENAPLGVGFGWRTVAVALLGYTVLTWRCLDDGTVCVVVRVTCFGLAVCYGLWLHDWHWLVAAASVLQVLSCLFLCDFVSIINWLVAAAS